MDNELAVRAARFDNFNDYAEGLDRTNWPLVRGCFAVEVLIDYGSLSAPSGAPDVPRRAVDWMQYLQGVINGFDITRHMITNHRVSFADSQVSCRAYLSADHVIFPGSPGDVLGPQDVVTVVGEYRNHYQEIGGRWVICTSELEVHYSTGNAALFLTAAERVAAAQAG